MKQNNRFILLLINIVFANNLLGMAQPVTIAQSQRNPLLQQAQRYINRFKNYKYARITIEKLKKEAHDPWAIAQAQYELAVALANLFEQGKGNEHDLEEAKQLWRAVAQQTVNTNARSLAEKHLVDLGEKLPSPEIAPQPKPEHAAAEPGYGPDNPLLQKAQKYKYHKNYKYVRITLNKLMDQSDDAWAIAEAYYLMGELDFFGKDGCKNVKAAIQWWEKAARQNVNELARLWSLCQLGELYLEGVDVAQDLDKAYGYFSAAVPTPEGELSECIQGGLEKIAALRKQAAPGKKRPAERAFEQELSESELSDKERAAVEKLMRIKLSPPAQLEEEEDIVMPAPIKPRQKRKVEAIQKPEPKRVKATPAPAVPLSPEAEAEQQALHDELDDAIFLNDAAAVERILASKKIIDINAPDKNGDRAMVFAAIGGSVEITKLLLRAGANPDLPDSHGFTALSAAAYHQNPDVAKVLLAAGADPSIKNTQDQDKTYTDYFKGMFKK